MYAYRFGHSVSSSSFSLSSSSLNPITLTPPYPNLILLHPLSASSISEGPMNPSLLSSLPSTHHSPLLPFRFAPNPLPPRRRFRTSSVRSSLSTDERPPTVPSLSPSDILGGKKDLTGIQPLVEKLSPSARLVTSAALLAGALASGYALGLRFGGSRNAALGGAALVGAAGGAAAYAVNSAVPDVAAISLHNYIAGCDGPGAIKKEDIENIAKKYGVSKRDEAFNMELCDIYCRFVLSVLPSGVQDLRGDEADMIVNFKSVLGIDDPDAAAMHMEIGRRIFRQRLETGDRDGDVEQRQAFQKLIFVSTLVFGEASSFLLPWKRVFKVTESQVEIALRENGKQLYANKLKSIGRDMNLQQLISLREAQHKWKLSDELAEDLFRDHARKLVEENISRALVLLKSRARAGGGVKQAVEELYKVLAFNDLLISLREDRDAVHFTRGVGPVSLVGGEYDSDRNMDDLKLLYRAYVADSLSSGRMEEHKINAWNQLQTILGLGKREAEAIASDITSKVYQKRLSEAFQNGSLEMAESKATFLQTLCDELHFDPQKAIKIHEEIYRKKLQQCVADGELDEADVAALLRVRVMLCIPQLTVEAAHNDICGSLFEKVVNEGIASGTGGYDGLIRKKVRKTAHGLRLSRDAAMSIASKAVRKIFLIYVRRSRAAENRTESAKELKDMIIFSTHVVTDLIVDIKGEYPKISLEDPAKNVEPADDEWESVESLRKLRSKEEAAKAKKTQNEITLRDDLSERDRLDLYRTYLLYCLTGEVVTGGFGIELTAKPDEAEYIFLNQLGWILGLTTKEIVGVHRRVAEETFRQKAEVMLADGQLTKARIGQLNELQKEIGLPQSYAQKVIKSITTTKLAGAIETAISHGKLNIKQIRELREAGVDLDSMITESLRESLLKKSIDEIFSSGTGEFDEEEVYEKIPSDLKINKEKAREVIHRLARTRLSNSLIQAVSLLRQRNRQGVVSSLNDMLACDKAVPSEPLSWDVPEELADLYSIYANGDPVPENLSRVQYLLGIDDSIAGALRERGDVTLSAGAEEENFVF